MPTKQIVRVKKTQETGRAQVTLSFEFSDDDPKAAAIYRGIALCLLEFMTDAEMLEFQNKLTKGNPYREQMKDAVEAGA